VRIGTVGLRIDRKLAEQKFSEALTLARGGAPLPEEWLERTRRIGEARSLTFTPALGTALLAKATDRRVDVFSLREGEGHRSYSARNLAKEVFVPQCFAVGVNIRTTGAEPLNNQPFFHSERIAPDLHVRENAREDLLYLCECLERADFLENEDALAALAGYLRARLEVSVRPIEITLGDRLLTPAELGRVLDDFVSEAEGGKVGQALAAALLDVVFDDVRTKRINDPGVKWPGDVGVYVDGVLVQAVEVKQKPMSESEVLQFVVRLADAQIRRGMVLALNQGATHLPIAGLKAKASEVYGIELGIFLKPSDVLEEAIRWSERDVPDALAELPRRGLERLQQIEATAARCKAWAGLFGSVTSP
jgi:hypothetical protein